MDMERRRSRRCNVYFSTGFISESTNYTGFTGNLSEDGLYVRISSTSSGIIFSDQTTMDLKVKVHMYEELELCCRLVWSYEIPQHDSNGNSAYNMGMKILDISPNYKNFYKHQAVENLNEYIKRYFRD